MSVERREPRVGPERGLRLDRAGEAVQADATRRVNFVLTRAELACLVAAARALRVTTSLLMYTAALEAAHRLGYYEGHEAPLRPRSGAWQDVPRRRVEDTATERLTVTVAPLHLRTLERAAREQLGEGYRLAVRGRPAPLQTFMLGSTLRFIATHVEKARTAAGDPRRTTAERRQAAAFLEQAGGPYEELRQRLVANGPQAGPRSRG